MLSLDINNEPSTAYCIKATLLSNLLLGGEGGG